VLIGKYSQDDATDEYAGHLRIEQKDAVTHDRRFGKPQALRKTLPEEGRRKNYGVTDQKVTRFVFRFVRAAPEQ